MTIVSQNCFIFEGTIKENITFFNEYLDEEINNAIEKSGFSDFIIGQKDGINSCVGENAKNISGGEKQRIALARAFLRKTPIMILDEATASLDPETTYNIEKNLLNIEGVTLLSITHKLDNKLLNKYDEILVMSC